MRKGSMQRRLVARFVCLLSMTFAVSVAEAGEVDRRLDHAGEVFAELINTPDRAVPEQLLAEARCIAVIPGVVKVAWFLGGRFGRGAISCRRGAADWSPPVLLTLGGGSVGFQLGASSTDVVLFFMKERGARSLLQSKFKLGADAAVAAGPVGRSAEASTDLALNAEIYSYARSRGFFAGVSLNGAWLAADGEAMAVYYGGRVDPASVLFTPGAVSPPASAWSLLKNFPGASQF
jgi:lipid-binding SYLF domain-containing protein